MLPKLIKNKYIPILIIVLIIFSANLFVKNVAFTGDETRFTYYTVSFAKVGNFNLKFPEWFNYEIKNNLVPYEPQLQNARPGHSIVVPILLSTIVNYIDFVTLRWSSFVIGIVGILLIGLLLRLLKYSKKVILFVLLIISTTIPVLPYFQIIYSDIWLFTFVSLCLYLLFYLVKTIGVSITKTQTKIVLFIITPIVFSFLPFLHLRLIGLTFVLLLIYIYNLWKLRLYITKLNYLSVFIVIIFMTLTFVYTQINIYGSVFSSASAAFTPSLNNVYDRLIVSLLDYRHGLFTFTPLLYFAFLGLISASLKRSKTEIITLLLISSLLVISIWGSASESLPGRFWVAVIPMLSIGLASWLKNKKSLLEILLFIILMIISYVNSIYYILEPNVFLNNRFYSYTYDKLFEIFPRVNLSVLFPWDTFPKGSFYLENSNYLGRLAGITLFTITLCLLFIRSKIKYIKILALTVFIIIVGLIFIYSFVSKVPNNYYQMEYTSENKNEVEIKFNKHINIAMLRFSEPKYYWAVPPYPEELKIEYSSDGLYYNYSQSYRSIPVVWIKNNGYIKSIKISSDGKSLKHLIDSNSLEIYRSIIGI